MMADDIVLQFNSVDYYYRSGFFLTKKKCLNSIDLSVNRGSVTSLVGPNGAGKTTTIKLAAGLIRPDIGDVELFGESAELPRSRSRMGLVTEVQYAYPFLMLREWISMLCGLSGLKGRVLIESVDRALELMGLVDMAKSLMKNLSKGQLQRAGIAQAFAHDPDILLLDEPMSGLDPYWRYKFTKIILEFKEKGGTVFFSSHILSDVEMLSDKVVLMQNGEVKWSGTLDSLDRHVQGYEIIAKVYDARAVGAVLSPSLLVDHPGGKKVFTIDTGQVEDVIGLMSKGDLFIESLVPLRDEIERVLFRL